jgi:adenine-specific DNA-methyltransferase
VKLGRFDANRISWSINYLKKGPLNEIQNGDLLKKGNEWEGGPAILEYAPEFLKSRRAKTVWHRTLHDAGTYGSNLLRSILGGRTFEFPKSLYAVRDTLSTIIGDNPTALVLDFFAGSGTTLHAVQLLNARDQGMRQCVIVTNNELSDEDEKRQLSAGVNPGDDEWEAQGICRSVTWPRCKFVTQGHRENGAELEGDYLSGLYEEEDVSRAFRGLDFAALDELVDSNRAKRIKSREALAQALGFPKSKLNIDDAFLLAEGERIAALLEWQELDRFVEKGSKFANAIETIYLPASSGREFNAAKTAILQEWPAVTKSVEIKRNARDGFDANVDYFRLDFLDRSLVETAGRLSDLLPALWMMAGSRGAFPKCTGREPMLFFEECRFAILAQESAFKQFATKLAQHPDVQWVFLVTNDQDSFARMSERLPDRIEKRIHIWRNYLDNFVINVDTTPGTA